MRQSLINKAKELKNPFWIVWSWSGKKVIHGFYQTEEEAKARAKKVESWKYYYTQYEQVEKKEQDDG